MSGNIVEWDKFYASISFRDLSGLAPEFQSRRNPTSYSRDKRHVYLSSLDLDVEVTNEGILREFLQSVKQSYSLYVNQGHLNIQKAYLARVDFLFLCKILYTLTGDEDFADPDFALNNPDSCRVT